jgi:predicted O-methyltransferase YrrM
LSKIDIITELLKYKKIEYYCGLHEYKYIYEEAVKCDSLFNAKIMEVGSYHGASTIVLANAVQADRQILSLDSNYKNLESGPGEIWLHNIKEFNLLDKVKILKKTSVEMILENCLKEYFKSESLEESLSFLFIDGGHDYYNCLADYLCFSKLLVKGGIMIFHDYVLPEPTWPDVNKLIEVIKKDKSFRLKEHIYSLAVFEKIEEN